MPEVKVGDGPVGIERISGGHSNLTYRITDAEGTPFALRRPPLGMVLATAHDMGREWRFISALAPFGVPVAPPVVFCQDTDVIGAEFYIMRFVDGEVLGDAESGHRLAEGESRTTAGLDTADVLAALHAVDPDEVGLSDLRRDGSYIERQLRRWHRQVHASSLTDLEIVDAAHERLVARAATLPPSDVRIAHGDYRPGNLAYGPDGRVRAIFDWELATLGDPLADLGWLMASWGRPADTVAADDRGPQPGRRLPRRRRAGRAVRRALRPRRRRPRLLRRLRPVARGLHPGRGVQPLRGRRARRGGGRTARARLDGVYVQAQAAYDALA